MNLGIKRWLPLTVLIIGIIIFYLFDLNEYANFATIKKYRLLLLSWTNEYYFLSIIIFCLIYIIATAFSLPIASLLTIVSGFLFGLIPGTIYVILSATLGATCAFLAVRTAFEPLLSTDNHSALTKMRHGFKKNAFSYLLVLRLTPLFPFWLVNIAAGLSGMQTRLFLLATALGIIPGTIIYVLIGNNLGTIFDQSKEPNLAILLTPAIIIPLLMLGLLILLPTFYKIFKR